MWGTEWIGTYAGWDRLLVAVTELSSAHSADEDSFMREAREAVDQFVVRELKVAAGH